MKQPQFWIAVAVTFVAVFLLEWLVHGIILDSTYQTLAQFYRPKEEMKGMMPYMILGYAIFAFAAVWIYDQGKQSKPFVVQGLRFGLALAAVAVIPQSMIAYAVQPLTCDLVCRQILFGIAEMGIVGVLVAKLRS